MTDQIESILLVEDEELIRLNMIAYLEDEGFDVVTASSGEEAMEILEKKLIDRAIVDIRLPGMNGTEFIQRAHKKWPTIKFVIYTGSTEYALPNVLREVGITEKRLLRKPLLDMRVLLEALELV